MSSGKQHGQGTAFRCADEAGRFTADGIHNRPDVIHASVERGRPCYPIRHSHPALVEQDQPGEFTQ